MAAESFSIGATQKIAATTTSAATANATPNGVNQIRLVSTVLAFVRVSKAGDAALVTDFPLAPNIPVILNVPSGGVKVSAILPTGTGDVYVTEVS